MTGTIAALFTLAILAAAGSWAFPKGLALDALAVFTLAVIGFFAPVTLAWLLASTAIAWVAMVIGSAAGRRGPPALAAGLILITGLVFSDFSEGVVWIGVSFFTLRLLHVLGDWWMGLLDPPRWRDLARYQFFLPVMVVGPIHRFPNFQRQAVRRRFDWSDALSGLERCLVGAFLAYVLGDVILGRVDAEALERLGLADGFGRQWLISALDWIKLYFVFAGLSAVALGASLIAGMRLEENFNRPWMATNLLDFWTRWHMSLTSWSRDYVFRPLMAITRSPLLGVIAAMLAIGLWHEISVYYVLWSVWQALGIVVSRLLGKLAPPTLLPKPLHQVAVFTAILGWLSLARPLIGSILVVANDAHLSLP